MDQKAFEDFFYDYETPVLEKPITCIHDVAEQLRAFIFQYWAYIERQCTVDYTIQDDLNVIEQLEGAMIKFALSAQEHYLRLIRHINVNHDEIRISNYATMIGLTRICMFAPVVLTYDDEKILNLASIYDETLDADLVISQELLLDDELYQQVITGDCFVPHAGPTTKLKFYKETLEDNKQDGYREEETKIH